MRNHYRVTVEFTYANGTPGGVLETIVNSKRAIEIQMEANHAWLDAKGHDINSVAVERVTLEIK